MGTAGGAHTIIIPTPKRITSPRLPLFSILISAKHNLVYAHI